MLQSTSWQGEQQNPGIPAAAVCACMSASKAGVRCGCCCRTLLRVCLSFPLELFSLFDCRRSFYRLRIVTAMKHILTLGWHGFSYKESRRSFVARLSPAAWLRFPYREMRCSWADLILRSFWKAMKLILNTEIEGSWWGYIESEFSSSPSSYFLASFSLLFILSAFLLISFLPSIRALPFVVFMLYSSSPLVPRSSH